MNRSALRFAAFTLVMMILTVEVIGQSAIPEVLTKGSIGDQMKYITEKTAIYENYRAIREDMFQLIKNNAIDSLQNAKKRITEIQGTLTIRNNNVDSLSNILGTVREDLNEMTRTKNAITVIGINLNKKVYNSVMWIIIAGLVCVLLIGYLAFKRSYVITRNTKNEFNDLKQEFEEYRNKTRLEREKMSMDHFKEIQKLRKP